MFYGPLRVCLPLPIFLPHWKHSIANQ